MKYEGMPSIHLIMDFLNNRIGGVNSEIKNQKSEIVTSSTP
jgi:hypothetical protein